MAGLVADERASDELARELEAGVGGLMDALEIRKVALEWRLASEKAFRDAALERSAVAVWRRGHGHASVYRGFARRSPHVKSGAS